jgi:hypothetical protein
MSNNLLNAHVALGEPCGPDATLKEMADWAGGLLLDAIQEGGATEKKLARAEARVRELETAIRNCVNHANNLESEWGNRAMVSFNYILRAIGEPTWAEVEE